MTRPLYVETSALVRAVLEGDDAMFDRLSESFCVTSSLTLVEAARSIARARAVGRIDDEQAAKAGGRIAAFERDCDEMPLAADVLRRARNRFPVEPVRTLDALHLATVEILAAELGELAVASFDDRVRENAAAWNLELVPPVHRIE